MRRIIAATDEHLALLCSKVEYVASPNMRGIALLVDDVPQIVVGYDGWTEGSVVMHQWISHPRYLGRDIIREAFRFPFSNGLRTVLGVVRSDNPEALRLDAGLGFLTAAVIPDAYGPGVDMHILHLPSHLCKWYTP